MENSGDREGKDNHTFDGSGTTDDVLQPALTGKVEHTLAIKAEGEVVIWKYLPLSPVAALL